jgi:TPR repeat protein
MKKTLQLGLLTAISMISAPAQAAEYEVIALPSLPSMVLSANDLTEYPGDCLAKANQAYRILQVEENPTKEMLTNGVKLLTQAAQAGDPYSLEQLANMALYGQYGVPQDVEWAINTFIYLAENGSSGSWNSLNAIDQQGGEFLQNGEKEKARQAFLVAWTRRSC